MHVGCFKPILITNSYIFGSSKGTFCVLYTLKVNRKYFASMAMTPPTGNKAVINVQRLQLFLKMRIVNTKQISVIWVLLES